MDRQFLKGLELEPETIDKIMDEHGSSVNSVKEQLNSKKDELKQLKSERDDLKAKVRDVEDNQDTIDSLRSKYDDAKNKIAEYEKQVQNNKLDQQIIKNVQDAYDVDDVLNYLDRSKFEYDDDGNISNFDDVLNAVRESKPHYFNTQSNSNTDPNNDPNNDPNQDPNQSGGNDPNNGGGTNNQTPGVQYATGKPNGSGNPGSNDFEALGQKWAQKLGGGK
jgi:hypothetical protein